MSNQPSRDERGAASLIQLVLVAPVLLLVLMFIVQFALVAHARSVVEAAAEQGSAVARRADGTQAETVKYLDKLGPKMLTTRSVSASRTADTATVTVTGTVLSLVPGIHPKVKETASGPVERYVPPVEQAP
jgi:Flp pilus assembly protein TadG